MDEIITEIEKYKKGWGGGLPETPCGTGSTILSTREQREWIPKIIIKYQIKTIADIGAGDLNWIKQTNLSGVEYQGYDLVPRHPDVKEFDCIKQIPPKVDLLMYLWVLNHFPLEHCRKALENIHKSGAKYLMMTDRERYRIGQPKEIGMQDIDRLKLNDENDYIRLIKL